MFAEGFVVVFELFHHLVIGAGHAEDGFAVADGFGVECEARVAPHELHDVSRGVWTDAGEGREELEDLVVGPVSLDPFVIDVAFGEELGKIDDALVAVSDSAASSECSDAGSREFLCGGERGDSAGGFGAADFAESSVHVDGAGPGDIATGDGFDDIFE